MRNFFKKLFEKKDAPKKFMFTSRNLADMTGNGEMVRRDGGNRWARNNSLLEYVTIDTITNSPWSATSTTGVAVPVSGMSKSPNQEDQRREAEPIAVFKEIKTEPLDISFDNLNQKIKNVEERIDILKEHLDEAHLQDEHRALFYLKNRRKYLDTKAKNPID